jgi:hypothetical protein
MRHHFRLRFSENAHGYGVAKKASDCSFLKPSLLGDLIEGKLASMWSHIGDAVAA